MIHLALIVHYLFTAYTLLLFGRILGSWFPQFRGTRIFRFLCFYADPYLNIFRRIIPPIGMVDISPIAAFFVLQLLEKVIMSILLR